jgi:hypothetical protein
MSSAPADAVDTSAISRPRSDCSSSRLAVVIGLVGACLAKGLLALIAVATNLFFFGRLSTAAVTPADAHLGAFLLLVSVIGGLIIGLMARFGSERIRGHGIPEAIEAILMNRSRVEPKVALLKPLSSAISIGSGGPFGAEGPIIMTGSAFGSVIAPCFHTEKIARRGYHDEPLRVVVHRMAETGLTHFPIVERGSARRLLGMISLEDLLIRARNLDAERRRERVMRVRVAFPFALGRTSEAANEPAEPSR